MEVNVVEMNTPPNTILLKSEGMSAFLRCGDGEEKIIRVAESIQKILDDEKIPLWMCEVILQRVREGYGDSIYKR